MKRKPGTVPIHLHKKKRKKKLVGKGYKIKQEKNQLKKPKQNRKIFAS